MDANYAADTIISAIKKSNLNFYIQESPFSLLINLRKTFIKNKNGVIIQPPIRETTNDSTEQVKKLEQENYNLRDTVERLEAELNVTKNVLKEMRVELEKTKSENLNAFSTANEAIEQTRNIENENKALHQKNEDLQANIETLEIEKHTTEKKYEVKS